MRRSRTRGAEISRRAKIERRSIIFFMPGTELGFQFDRQPDGIGPLLAKGPSFPSSSEAGWYVRSLWCDSL
jgi:hypothetical protein